MNAGLPSTGIGGIFYFFSVVLMVLVEMVKTLKGTSSIKRWKFVTGQTAMLVSILGAIWGTGTAIAVFVPEQVQSTLSSISSKSSLGDNYQTLFLTPFIILGSLLILTQAMRMYLRLSKAIKG